QPANHQDNEEKDTQLRIEEPAHGIAEEIDDEQQQEELKQRNKEIGQPHEHVIDPATTIPGSGPNSRANEYGDEHCHQPYRHGYPATVEHARQEILPEVVCP